MEAERSQQCEPDERLYPILVDFLESTEVGARPDRQTLLARHPELASELQEFVDTWDRIEGLTEPIRSVSRSMQAAARSARPSSPPSHQPFAGAKPTFGGPADVSVPDGIPGGKHRGTDDDSGGWLARWLRQHPPLKAEHYPFLHTAKSAGEIGKLGPYRLLEVIGSGGMGIVFRGEDVSLRRMVAVKVLKTELAADAASHARFLREARSAAALDHEHVVAVYHVGEESGVPFLGMQWLRGTSLEALLQRARRLEVPVVLRLGRQIALGLAAAHEIGLLHRDVKPANLWVEPPGPSTPAPASAHEAAASGRIKILDFGLCRTVAEEGLLTNSGVVVGTPAYMAPEQAAGQAVDSRCDLFSLGVVLYRMCTGQLPFRNCVPPSAAASAALGELPSVRELNPDVSAGLADLIKQLLSFDPDQRPASAAEVANRLAALAGLSAVPATELVLSGRRQVAASQVWRTRVLTGAGLAALVLVYLLGRMTVRPAINPPGPITERVAETKSMQDGSVMPDDSVLREVASRIAGGKHRLPRDIVQLYDKAEEIYRAACKSTLEGDHERADELAMAAYDAARGLNHVVRAILTPEAQIPPLNFDRPPPPPGRKGPRPPPPDPPRGEGEPWRAALHELERVRDRLDDAGNEPAVGDPFRDAARTAYAQARQAYTKGDYRKAAELARGADIWTHVDEHLWRARYEGVGAPPVRPSTPAPSSDGPHSGRPLPPPRPDDRGPGDRDPGNRGPIPPPPD